MEYMQGHIVIMKIKEKNTICVFNWNYRFFHLRKERKKCVLWRYQPFEKCGFLSFVYILWRNAYLDPLKRFLKLNEVTWLDPNLMSSVLIGKESPKGCLLPLYLCLSTYMQQVKATWGYSEKVGKPREKQVLALWSWASSFQNSEK